jgi:hypothetical protein
MTSLEPPAILPQARVEVQRAPDARYESRLPLPSRSAAQVKDPGAAVESYVENVVPPPSAQTLPLAQIQRIPESKALPAMSEASIVNFVQRAASDSSEEDGAEKPPVDLDELARMVYPLIKRLLAVEQERLARRR